jgi:hypothetical protein
MSCFYRPNTGDIMTGSVQLAISPPSISPSTSPASQYLNFGRACNMDRRTVAATWLALEEWTSMDHVTRWTGNADAMERLARGRTGLPKIHLESPAIPLKSGLASAPIRAIRARSLTSGIAQPCPSADSCAESDSTTSSTLPRSTIHGSDSHSWLTNYGRECLIVQISS